MKIEAPRSKPKPFVAACNEYLKLKRDALMASIAGTPLEAVMLACARENWLMPYETMDDVTGCDLFDIYPEFWWVKVKAGLLSETQAKREIASIVEREARRWRTL